MKRCWKGDKKCPITKDEDFLIDADEESEDDSQGEGSVDYLIDLVEGLGEQVERVLNLLSPKESLPNSNGEK